MNFKELMLVDKCAELCHKVNKVYCEFIGDNSQPAWSQAPKWQKDSAVKGVRHILENPNAQPSDSHDSWLAEKRAAGWCYGPVKDPELKQHPCFLKYEELGEDQKVKDKLFIAVVKSFFNI